MHESAVSASKRVSLSPPYPRSHITKQAWWCTLVTPALGKWGQTDPRNCRPIRVLFQQQKNSRWFPTSTSIIFKCNSNSYPYILISTNKCRHQSSPKKLPFALEGKHVRKPQLLRMQRTTDYEMPHPYGYSYSTVPAPKAQRTLWKRGRKTLRVRGPGCQLWDCTF